MCRLTRVMMFSQLSAIVLKVFLFLNICSLFLKVEACPSADLIAPCRCFQGPHTHLECKGIHDDAVLRKVFHNSENHQYVRVHIYYSTLKYLPHEMFTLTQVQELHLENSTLESLFDSPPEELSMLRKLHLENTNIAKLSNWNLLKPLTSLKILEIYYNTVKTLDPSMDQFINTGLEQLALYATETSKIEPGALTQFVNLDKLAIDGCKLKELTRDLFPRPFNVRHIYFIDNEMDAIPDDLFADMPRLSTVGLRKNFLTMIPETAFDGITTKIGYIMLDDNPLKCDCQLLWLIKSKPKVLTGTCATPIRLHDKKLEDLTTSDFKCKI